MIDCKRNFSMCSIPQLTVLKRGIRTP